MNEVIAQFLPGGSLAAKDGYEDRPAQLEYAAAADDCFTRGGAALLEAGCGTGKSFGYLVAAVRHAVESGRKCTVSTANILLQEQLVRKDLPTLQRLLPWPFTFALLKGRNNYLCRSKHKEPHTWPERHGAQVDEADTSQCNRIMDWGNLTETGDVSELGFAPSGSLWSWFSVSMDECRGSDCRFHDSCFTNRAKVRAETAHVLVVNHHLLLADVLVRELSDGRAQVLPDTAHLVVDEAHDLADVARDFFGYQVGRGAVSRVVRGLRRCNETKLANDLTFASTKFFTAVGAHGRSRDYKVRLRGRVEHLHVLAIELDRLLTAAEGAFENRMDGLPREAKADLRNMATSASNAAERACEGVCAADPGKVYFIDPDREGCGRLCAKVFDVEERIEQGIFAARRAVVMTSATLSVGGKFDFCRRELGVPREARELVVDSPFQFEQQAMLVVPRNVPEPRDPRFVDMAASAIVEVIKHCGGRTLALFTSHANLDAAHERVLRWISTDHQHKHTLLKQGDAPRGDLVARFTRDVGSVLMGTSSFWTGVDVPGEALTGLVVDKLPFPNMSDPVVDRVQEDPGSFGGYMLPKAVITLRQGVGRLIRTKSDRGVVVILDRRLVDKSYGRVFLTALPRMQLSGDLGDIAEFLDEGDADGEARLG
jgi:ATP-dependent DNA helicase DinG